MTLPLEISVQELETLLKGDHPPRLLDVREGWERDICKISPSEHIPLGLLAQRWNELDASSMWVVYCHHGGRSLRATRWLREQGMSQVINLRGGIDQWAHLVDSGMARY